MKLAVFIVFGLVLRTSSFASDTLNCSGGYFDSTLSIQVYDYVEVAPAFPGGETEMLMFIHKHLMFPEISKEQGVQGRVYIKFVVTDEGKIVNVETVHHKESELSALERECIRVIQLMPDWSPGLCNGIKVATAYYIPLTICPN
jgi:protein TonB